MYIILKVIITICKNKYIFTFLLVNKHLYIAIALPELFSKNNLELIEKCEL